MNERTVATARPDRPFGWRFTAPLLLGSTLNPINSSMIATALVGIGADMHAGPGATASLISVLYLCCAVAQPTMGKLSETFGPRRVFLTGIFILLVGGVLGAAAPSFGTLVASRALIGIGTSAGYPTAMALVRKRADDCKIGVPSRILGNFTIAGQVTTVIGLPLGGILAGVFGWRAIFTVNIPVAIVGIALTLAGVAKDPPVDRDRRGGLLTALDLPGIALFAALIVCVLVVLADVRAPDWRLLAAIVPLAAALVVWERRTPSPVIDMRMLAGNLPLLRTYLRQILSYLATYAFLYGASQWMEQGKHLDASSVGLLLLPLSAFSIVVVRVVSGRGWVRWPLVLAGLALMCSAVVMSLVTHESSVAVLVGMSLLVGLTTGFTGFGNQATLYLQSPARNIAVASGLLRTSTYIGAIFSSSLIGLAFGSSATDAGLHTLAFGLFGLGALVALLAAFDRGIPSVAR